jgi:PAS domain-containing protein
MDIPTEPIGSIPRPLALIEAIGSRGDGTDPGLNALYDEAIRDTNGNIAGAVMVFHDVTQRRRAERALRERDGRRHATERHKIRSVLPTVKRRVPAE